MTDFGSLNLLMSSITDVIEMQRRAGYGGRAPFDVVAALYCDRFNTGRLETRRRNFIKQLDQALRRKVIWRDDDGYLLLTGAGREPRMPANHEQRIG